MSIPNENELFPKKLKQKKYTYGQILDGPNGWIQAADWFLKKQILSKNDEWKLKYLMFTRKYRNGLYSEVPLIQSCFSLDFDACKTLSLININQIDNLGNNSLIAAVASIHSINGSEDRKLDMKMIRKNIIFYLLNNNINQKHKNNASHSAYILAEQEIKSLLFHYFIKNIEIKYGRNGELKFKLIINQIILLLHLDLEDAVNRAIEIYNELSVNNNNNKLYKINQARLKVLNKLSNGGIEWEDDGTNAWIRKNKLTIIIPYTNKGRPAVGIFFNFENNKNIDIHIKNTWLNKKIDRQWFKGMLNIPNDISQMVKRSGFVMSMNVQIERDNTAFIDKIMMYLDHSTQQNYFESWRIENIKSYRKGAKSRYEKTLDRIGHTNDKKDDNNLSDEEFSEEGNFSSDEDNGIDITKSDGEDKEYKENDEDKNFINDDPESEVEISSSSEDEYSSEETSSDEEFTEDEDGNYVPKKKKRIGLKELKKQIKNLSI